MHNLTRRRVLFAVITSHSKYSTNTNTLRQLQFATGACAIPHPKKKETGGEDAWFACPNIVGVADGVGGWARNGIDAGDYSRGLMRAAKSIASIQNNQQDGLLTPLEILKFAHEKTTPIGSSTACIVQVQDSELRAINLGDSGFLLCRLLPVDLANDNNTSGENKLAWQVIYEAPFQSHFFNCPYQLGQESTDLPEHGEFITVETQPGDILVLGTDGVFDNMFPAQISKILDEIFTESSGEKSADEMTKLANIIAQKAHESALETTTETPFAVAAKRAGYRYKGGKMDDITVVTSQIITFNDTQTNHRTL